MATPVHIPKLGLTMTDALLEEWVANEGDVIQPGDVLMRIETDKVNADIEAEGSGVLHQVVAAGTVIEAGTLVGWLVGTAEAAPEVTRAGSSLPGRIAASPFARRLASDANVSLDDVTGTGPGRRIVAADVREAIASSSGDRADIARTHSPLVRRQATTLGVSLSEVQGSGPAGRVVRADLERTLANLGADRDAVSATPQTSNLVPLTGMRGVIAERMVNSLREMAQLTIGADVRADALVAARASLKHAAQLGGPRAPTITDFVVRAVGLSLRVHPRLNATIRDNAIHLIDTINVGIAVALDEGLVVPVISEADQRSIWEISELSRELATKARGSQLTLSELESGTFTVSTLGQFGVDFFTPVISSGQVAILGVGRTREIAAVEHGALVVGQSMTLSLSFDHRAVDGAPAARFLQTVADFLADPLSMA